MSGSRAYATSSGPTYALLADLPLAIESYAIEPLSRREGGRSTRETSAVHLRGADQEGVGEDITPAGSNHPPLALAGDWTLDSFSAHLATLELFSSPPHPMLRPFRRWALESAALDLALRQSGRSLANALGRPVRPVAFVNSPSVPDPPALEPIRRRLELYPGLRLKLDPTVAWSEDLIEKLAATAAVDVLDLKGQYPPQAAIAQPPDPLLYQRVARAFPHAWIEDPVITPETREVLEPHRHRITWDAPLRSLADVRRLAHPGRAINVKPVRFGSLKALLEVYDHCAAAGIRMYGGGFDEIGPGREQIQYLASLFHPDAANDVAPSDYNRQELPITLPASPLTRAPAPSGFRWI